MEPNMQKIDAGSAETHSADLVAAHIQQLKALFPELVTEGKDGVAVNVDVLKALVGDKTVTDADEKYGLNWHGKRRARQLALTPSSGTLRPCPEESLDWDSTQNLMIEGDNLEVLKLLQKSYSGKVKLIYIDPPYNTGKDFVYPDNFQDNIKNYLELTGQVEGGQKISSNTEASGRFHTDWLNMMYPRLKLARNLLRDDGVIFVSIDDSELANLKEVCDELFGAETFIGRITWERKRKGSHLSQEFVQKTESLLIYSRSAESIRLFGEPAGDDEDQPLVKRTNAHKVLELPQNTVETSMSDQNFLPGRYGEGSSSVELMEPATIKSGRFVSKVRLNGPFIWTQDNLDYELGEGARFFIRTMNFSLRALKAPHRQGFKALPSFLSQDTGTNEDALTELADLFEIEEDSVPFDYPKPARYISKIVSAATYWDKDAICLDFFAGSGTTGHAVMAQNAADGGNRRYILVQLPEPLDPKNKDQKTAADFCDQLGKPRTIAELTKERLRRAAAKIRAEVEEKSPQLPLSPSVPSGGKGELDLGFRVFKLDSSNIHAWAPEPDNLAQSLLDATEHLKAERSENDILFELLLKLGLDLAVPITTRRGEQLDSRLRGKDDLTAHSVAAGVLLVCLADKIASAEVEALALGLVAWHKELAPAMDTTCVFRDSAFENDVAKTNLAAILEQHGLRNVRSL